MSTGTAPGGEPSRRDGVGTIAALPLAGRTLLGAATLVVVGGLVLTALLLRVRQAMVGRGEEPTALVVVIVAALVGVLPSLWYAARTRRDADPAVTSELLTAGVAVALVGVFGYVVADAVRFHADILLWSESGFLADVLKLSVGYPLYSSPADLTSSIYTPGAPMLSGLLAGLLGRSTDVPTLRMIQVGYVVAAAVVGAWTAGRLLMVEDRPDRRVSLRVAVLWVAVLVLVGANTITNPFTFLLHNDALSLLVSVVAYACLVGYAGSGHRRWLVAMAVIPAVGFWVKQSLGIWAPFFVVYLLVFDRRLRWPAVAAFTLAAFGGIGAAVGLGWLLWGPNFRYWVVTVLGGHPFSVLRSILHLLDAWVYLAALMVGAVVLVRSRLVGRLAGLWLVATGLLLVEAYTSGIAWMRNHMGPGSLLAAIWLLAAATRQPALLADGTAPAGLRWMRHGAAAVLALLVLNGFGAIRVPTSVVPADVTRYAGAIEHQFQGLPPDRVLLDFGTWLYAPEGIVMKDRAAAIGDAGYSETADVSGIMDRIRHQYYRKILVRAYHGREFAYDQGLWRHPSGIRDSLGRYYREVGEIPRVQGGTRLPPWFDTISVLTPVPGDSLAR